MGTLKLLIFALTSLASLNPLGAQIPTLNDEVLGLIVFRSSLIDPHSHLSSWDEDDTTPCSWSFITCEPGRARVTAVSLDGLSLSGKIGRGLEKLPGLKTLSLAQNNLTGTLDHQFSLLTGLEHLNLSHNGLAGRIPTSLIDSGRLKFLDLSRNAFSGPIVEEFFMNCSSLRAVSLSGNLLEGQIPGSLARCTVLNHLDLSRNRFSGSPRFVSGLWSLTRIRTLDLSHNALSGSLPEGALTLHDLKELFLQENQFSGALPHDLGLCPHLKNLDLSNNLFTDTLPASLQNLSSLNHLNLANNRFTGDFPQWIGALTGLEHLDFSGNRFTGILPASMGGLTSLSYVSLCDNSLSGSIPDGVFELGLNRLDFSRNRLTGSIPRGSSRLFDSVQFLDLSANGLTGDIPAEIGLYSKLTHLNLSWNSFDTRLPPEFGYFQNLTALDLRNGAFRGPIPGDLCDSGSLRILQLDGNSLTGSIPEEIGNCSSLYLLSMSHNNLSGSIPRSMALSKKLKILKLDYNQLSGEIPQELGGLESLLALNLSYNRLQGRLPAGGIFPSLQQSSLEGNLGICSPLLKGPCKMNVPKPLVLDPNAYGKNHGGGGEMTESPSATEHHMFLSISAVVAILSAAAIAVGVVVITLLNVSARKRLAFVDSALESCSSSTHSGAGVSTAGKLVWFDSKIAAGCGAEPESLLEKAAEIGGGAFGTVYKASSGEPGGCTLAVKNLVVSNTVRNHDEFDREVRVLAKAIHPNLVSLKGYLWTPRCQLLVTEFAPNGSLRTRLHDGPPLSWPNRFKILLGTAKGLAHLHHSFRPPIVHYSLKPANVLLDHHLNPKLSDFGLTRLLAKLDTHLTSSRFQSAVGYVAPELACENLRVNEKCDVYGFGVLVLEVVTGRRPVEYGGDKVVILNEVVKAMLEEGNVLECVDGGMGDEYPEEEVLPVLKLALVCTSQIPSSRPSMAEVVQILQVIKTPVPPQRMEAF